MIYSDLKIDELGVDGKKEYIKYFEENGWYFFLPINKKSERKTLIFLRAYQN